MQEYKASQLNWNQEIALFDLISGFDGPSPSKHKHTLRALERRRMISILWVDGEVKRLRVLKRGRAFAEAVAHDFKHVPTETKEKPSLRARFAEGTPRRKKRFTRVAEA